MSIPNGAAGRPDRPRLRRGLQEIKKEFELVTKILVVASGVAWLFVSALVLLIGFESSEYQKSWERWLHDLSACIPIWISFIGFTGLSVAVLRYRLTTLAFLTTVVSLVTIWNVFSNRIFG